MRQRILAGSAAGLVVVALLHPGASPRILDRRTADYLEGGGVEGRAIAALTAQLVATEGGGALELVISASGPFVDPVPGFEGVRGANQITAREIDEIARGRSMTVETTDASGMVRAGMFCPGRRGRIPVRRLDHGRIVWDAWSDRDYVLELRVGSGALPPGEHATGIRVDGRQRLRVRFVLGAGEGRILDLESLDAHPLRAIERRVER